VTDVPAQAAPGSGGLDSGALSIGPERVINMLREGSVTMWALVACSILTLSFVLERLIVLRAGRVIPKTFVDRFMDRLRDDELDRAKAIELCRDNGSPIANVFAVIAQHWGRPASEIRSAVGDRAESELFYLRRRIRALNGLATLAPLLGLFGTVIGMIEAFHALSQPTGGGKTERLAEGISLALVATASGLAVAIVAAASYYFLLGRVDRLVQRMDLLSNEVVDHVAADARAAEKAAPRPRVVPAREQASI
jgi:biopolymer transport protein ExbB